MNQTILTLEKRKAKVLRMRSAYVASCEKETDVIAPNVSRYDQIIDKIIKAIKAEWNKLYRK